MNELVGPPERMPEARVLIIDDEPANTTILERLLRQAGYDWVVVTNDSRTAIPLYEEFRPDLLLLDLHMPDIDGYEILGSLADPQRAGLRPPIVVLTADATRPARERALTLGADDFLTKPLDHLEVLLRIRSHLARRALELEMLFQNVDLERAVAERTASLRATLDKVRETSERERRLASALVTAQEAERRRIANDVHDGSVQALVTLGMRLDLLAHRIPDPALRTEAQGLRTDVAAVMEELHGLIFRLAPESLARDGLAAALGVAIARLEPVAGPRIVLDAQLSREPSTEQQTILYHIALEALRNATRHARANRIDVVLTNDDTGIRLEVRDDGVGFQVPEDNGTAASGLSGLASMRERAELGGGRWRVESSVAGTAVIAWLPAQAGTPVLEPDLSG